MRWTLASAAMLVACHARSTAPDPVPDAAPAAPPVALVDAAAPVALAPSFSSEQWLHEQGITTWKHDPSCFTNMISPPAPPSWQNLCDCDRALTLNGHERIELLVCKRFGDFAEPRTSPTQHTMLYAAKKGTIRLVVDMPTYVGLDSESFMESGPDGRPTVNVPVGNVRLAVSVDGAEVVVSDDGGTLTEPCATALATAQREKLVEIRRAYGKVCASIGRYRFSGDQLVRAVPPSPR